MSELSPDDKQSLDALFHEDAQPGESMPDTNLPNCGVAETWGQRSDSVLKG